MCLPSSETPVVVKRSSNLWSSRRRGSGQHRLQCNRIVALEVFDVAIWKLVDPKSLRSSSCFSKGTRHVHGVTVECHEHALVGGMRGGATDPRSSPHTIITLNVGVGTNVVTSCSCFTPILAHGGVIQRGVTTRGVCDSSMKSSRQEGSE